MPESPRWGGKRTSVIDPPVAAIQHFIMQAIELDGSRWTERWDCWRALREALGVVPEHGTNFAAFEDSVFYAHELLSVRPPFAVTIYNPSPETLSDIEAMAHGWAEQREWKREHYGEDVQATLVVKWR